MNEKQALNSSSSIVPRLSSIVPLLALVTLAAKTDAADAMVDDLLNYLPMRYFAAGQSKLLSGEDG